MSLRLFNAESFHQPAVLLWRQFPGLGFRAWPLEVSRLQALVQQEKTVTFPVQCFHTVSASAAEEEEGVGEWIQLELLLNNAGQAVNPTSEVCVAAGNVDLACTGKVV